MNQLTSILRNPHFWAILLLTAFFGFIYYGEYFNLTVWFTIDDSYFQREYPHDIHRLLFLIPMLYAAFKFRIKGSVIIFLVVSCIILPYSIVISPHENPVLRTVAFLLIAFTAAILLAISEDQRDRKRVLASIVESAEEAIIGETLDGKIAHWNLGAQKLYGYSAEEAIGHPISMVVPREVSDDIPNILKKVQQGEEVEQYETTWVRKDGRQIYVALQVSPIKDSDGSINGASVMAFDITRRKRAEEENAKLLAELEERVAIRTAELAASERRWATTLSSIGDAVIATEINGRITFMNSAAEELTGWTFAEASSKPVIEVFNIINSETKETVENLVSRVIRKGQIIRLDNNTILVRKDGTEVPIDDSGAPIINNQGMISGVVLVFRDTTERKRVERMKDEFLSLVSHELRTPLTVIKGSMEVVLDGRGLLTLEETREMMQNVVENANILHDILENMLELNRHQAGRMNLNIDTIDILSLANRVIDRLQGYGARQSFHLEIPDDLPAVKADPLRIERILHNLLDNAVKYSPEESEIGIVAQNNGGYLVVSVIDRGEGISKEDMDELFQLFGRLDESKVKTGSGLGLVVCQRLVEAHGGWIKVDSTLGQGTTFSFALPLYPED